jgi:hypothetical protein
LALVACTGLSGCLSGGSSGGGPRGETASERLEATVGLSERDVISRWGTPDDSFEFADGGRTLTWEHGYWNEAWEEQWHCEITLETDPAGTIVDWGYEYDYGAANPCHDIMNGNS